MKQLLKQPASMLLLLFISLLLIAGCKKKEETQTVVNLPVIITLPPADITTTTATVGGNITSNGGGTILQKGVCYRDAPDPSISDSVVSDHKPGGNYNFPISGLTPNTVYYAKAFAINNAGIRYGAEVTFTTLKVNTTPTIFTFPITAITSASATSGGKISSDGGNPVTAKGICWGTTHSPTISDSHTTDGPGSYDFTSTMSGLSMRTPYFVRAYATNSIGTAYGNEESFTTADSTTGQSCPGIPEIVYEGKTYHTVLIGQKCWLRENLNVGTMIIGINDMIPGNQKIEKYCYNDQESNCTIYGGLYQWDEVMQANGVQGSRGICPQGWHIPTFDEWNEMITIFGGFNIAGTALKFNTLWFNGGNGTNLSGFAGIPGGLRYYDGRFTNLGNFGYYWSSQSYDATRAWYNVLNYANTRVETNFDQKRLGYSARCVKDTIR